MNTISKVLRYTHFLWVIMRQHRGLRRLDGGDQRLLGAHEEGLRRRGWHRRAQRGRRVRAPGRHPGEGPRALRTPRRGLQILKMDVMYIYIYIGMC